MLDPECSKIITRLCSILEVGDQMPVNLKLYGHFYVTRLRDGGLQVDRIGDYYEPNTIATADQKPVDPKETWGPQRWAELHTWALTMETPGERMAFLATFTSRIPCGECKTHWREVVSALPPQTQSKDQFFAWTVDAHNRVNVSLGKMQRSYTEMLEHWTNKLAKVELVPQEIDARKRVAFRRTAHTISVVHVHSEGMPEHWMSNPMLYYTNEAEAFDLITSSIEEIAAIRGNVIVCGPVFGDLPAPLELYEKIDAILRPTESKKVVVWGGGRTLGDYPHPHMPRFFGIREFGLGLPYVPDASCLYAFPTTYATEEVGCVESWRDPLHLRLESIDDTRPPNEQIAFIARFRTIVTNCQHASYWATLMGRKVVAIPREGETERFQRQRYQPTIGRRDTWKADATRAKAHPEALARSRAVTDEYALQVGVFFGRKLTKRG